MDEWHDSEVNLRWLRWRRAAAWAGGQSLGPWGQAEGREWRRECERIEALRDRILEVGEDLAYAEYCRANFTPEEAAYAISLTEQVIALEDERGPDPIAVDDARGRGERTVRRKTPQDR